MTAIADRIRRELEGMHPYTLTISGLLARRREFLLGALEVLDAPINQRRHDHDVSEGSTAGQ